MKFILKVVIAFIVALLLWEPILENCITKTPGYIVHPVLGRICKQGTYIHGAEGYSRTSINNYGMRGPEIKNKTDNEYRILVLGDSYTEAFQVSDIDAFPTQLQKKLKHKFNEITVINAGKSGASPARYIYLENFYKMTFEPDFVVVQLNDGDFTKDILDSTRDFYVKQEYGTFKTEYNPNYESSTAIMRTFPRLRPLLELSVFRVGFDKMQHLLKGQNIIKNKQPIKSTSIQNYHNIISWTMATLKNKYPNIVILYLPTIDYEKPDKPKSEVETLVELYAKNNAIQLINMRSIFIDYYQDTLQPAHGFDNTTPGSGHANTAGHNLISSQLANYIEEVIQ